MKIPLIFTLHLISGPVGCFDVIGFPGGEVRITCKYQNSAGGQKSFCKLRTLQECGNSITSQRGQFNTGVHEGRFSLVDNPVGALTATIRHLSLQDSGLYRCEEAGGWSYDVNLRVNEDPCCLRLKTVTGYLGETVTISCSYPEELQNKTKFFFKQYGQYYTEVIRSSDSQTGRFSISEDRSSKVVSVRISDVREEDGGVYSCAVSAGGEPVSYYTRYTEIQLQVSVKIPTSTAQYGFYIIITVSVCVGLLLIGGLTLSFYKLGCTRTQGVMQIFDWSSLVLQTPSPPICRQEETLLMKMIQPETRTLLWIQSTTTSTPTNQKIRSTRV
ncbi:polymeric immunoglobulin receptor-like isoform X2 [Salminus brasiliensis]|uniref:polymeric immunoglobulin receptor-like isoform X2 n=1 Tax=Salminus brasiliensis TaxID=930266 RepID=UPI003B8391C3